MKSRNRTRKSTSKRHRKSRSRGGRVINPGAYKSYINTMSVDQVNAMIQGHHSPPPRDFRSILINMARFILNTHRNNTDTLLDAISPQDEDMLEHIGLLTKPSEMTPYELVSYDRNNGTRSGFVIWAQFRNNIMRLKPYVMGETTDVLGINEMERVGDLESVARRLGIKDARQKSMRDLVKSVQDALYHA